MPHYDILQLQRVQIIFKIFETFRSHRKKNDILIIFSTSGNSKNIIEVLSSKKNFI